MWAQRVRVVLGAQEGGDRQDARCTWRSRAHSLSCSSTRRELSSAIESPAMSPALPSRSVAEPTREEALLDLAPSRAAPAPDLGEADLALSETDPSSRPRWTRSASSVLAWMFLAASLAILALTAIVR